MKRTTRRRFLLVAGAGTAFGVTGCVGGGGETEEEPQGNETENGGGTEGGGGNETGTETEDGEEQGEEKEASETELAHEPWRSHARDAANTGHAPDAGPPSGELSWEYETDGLINASPAVVDGVVYVGSNDSNMRALDARGGGELWSFEAGDRILSSPWVTDELVVFGSDDSNLYGVGRGGEDAEGGGEAWRYSARGPIRAGAKAATVDGRDIVAFGEARYRSETDMTKGITATDLRGNEVWWFETRGELGAAPALAEGNAYAVRPDGFLYSVDAATAEQDWVHRPDGDLRAAPSVSVRDGRVFYGDTEGNVRALRTGGDETVWSYDAGSSVRSSPSFSEDAVYFGDESGTLHAVSMDGEGLWTFDTGDSIRTSPAVGDGYVAFGSRDNSVYALDLEGNEMWSYETGGPVESSPAIIDGRLYVGSIDWKIYAFE